MILTLQNLLQKSKQVSDLRDAHALALDLVESMLRHYAVVAIAAYRHAGARDAKINRILSEQLPRPSMGSWKNFLQMLSAAEKGLFPESFWDKFLQPLTKKISNPDIVSAYAGLQWLTDQDVFSSHVTSSLAESAPCTSLEFFDAAVAYRNRFAGHGTHELPNSALQNAPSFLKGAAALCSHLNALWLAYPVYVAKQAKLYGRRFFRLTPLVEAEGIVELQVSAPGMEEDRLYICFGDKKHPEVESLYPAALWEEGDILFANGTKGLIDIHYIGYASQRSFETSIYEEDFRTFLGTFALPKVSEEVKPAMISEPTPLEPSPMPSAKVIPSIAVLPFVNMSADPEQEYFCDGIAEEILNALAHIEGLRVIARTSTFIFKGQQKDIKEIGRKLDVNIVLEGSVRKSGNRLRITTQLINVADESHIWSEKYDRDMDDVFVIQDEISLSVVRELKIRLLTAEQDAVVKRHTANQEAYELYLKGRYFWNKRHEVGLKKGIECFQQAIEKDPQYALALTGIADCYCNIGLYGYMNPQEAYTLAKRAIDQALELDDSLAEVHTSLGGYKMWYEWDFTGAEKEFMRALEINQNYSTAYLWYSLLLGFIANFEASIWEIEQVQIIDPLSVTIIAAAGFVYTFARRFTGAENYYCKAIEIDPNYPQTYLFRGANFVGLGDWEQAIASYDTYMTLTKESPYSVGLLGFANAKSGKKGKGLQLLAQLDKISEKTYVSPYYIALVYIGLDEKKVAFEYLEKAYKEREPHMIMLKNYSVFDSLRDDSKFRDLVKKIGLPE